jgi:hypothetical protein
MNSTPTMQSLRLLCALSGAAFAILALVAYAINTGPSSADGLTVIEYYSAHGTATAWQAVLVGLAAICLIWFAETFARQMALGAAGLVSAAVTAALYLVAVGCWSILGEIFGGVDIVNVPSEGYGDAQMLYDVGVGAGHMGNFAAAAFAGATTIALIASAAPWRWLGWLGIAFTAFRLISALIEIASSSHWSDTVAIAGLLTFLAWVFVASVALVAATRRSAPARSDR